MKAAIIIIIIEYKRANRNGISVRQINVNVKNIQDVEHKPSQRSSVALRV